MSSGLLLPEKYRGKGQCGEERQSLGDLPTGADSHQRSRYWRLPNVRFFKWHLVPHSGLVRVLDA